MLVFKHLSIATRKPAMPFAAAFPAMTAQHGRARQRARRPFRTTRGHRNRCSRCATVGGEHRAARYDRERAIPQVSVSSAAARCAPQGRLFPISLRTDREAHHECPVQGRGVITQPRQHASFSGVTPTTVSFLRLIFGNPETTSSATERPLAKRESRGVQVLSPRDLRPST